MARAALLLVGGSSRRMGSPKADLRFGAETLLARTTRTLLAVAPLVVVVRSPGQELNELPRGVELAEDARPGSGPLEGLRAGLAAIGSRAEAVFLAAVDCPFLNARFVARMFDLLESYDAVVPRVADGVHPLAGCYRTRVRETAERLLAAGTRDLRSLIAAIDARFAAPPDLGDADPGLDSLVNINTPDEYDRALRRLGGLRG